MPNRIKWTIALAVFIVIILVSGILYLFVYKSGPASEPLKAIPVSASFIVKVNDYKALLEDARENNSIWDELSVIPGFGRVDRQMMLLDSLYDNMPEIKQILDKSPSYISAHLTGKERISMMHIFHLPERFGEKKVTGLISGLIINEGTLNIRKYEGVNIHEVVLLNESLIKNFSFAVTRNLLIFSNSTILLEDALRQLQNEESVVLNSEFKRIYNTAGKNVHANVFINFQSLSRMLSAFVKTDYKAEVRSAKSFAGWCEMDVNLLSDMLLMNGFITAADSVTSLVSLFSSQSPQQLTSDGILPGSVGSFLTLSFSDFGLYDAAYEEYLRSQGAYSGYYNTLQSLTNTYNIDFKKELLNILDNEITIAFDQEGQAGRPSRSYILLRVKSNAQAEEHMKNIISEIAAFESKPSSSYRSVYRFDNELSYAIYSLPVRKFIAKIFGGLFSFVDEHFFAVLDNYIVFSSSTEAITSLIHDHILSRTLRNDLTYKNYKDELSPRSNIFFYCNLSRSDDIYGPYTENEISQDWKKYLPVFQKVQAAGFQIYASNKMFYSNFLVKNSEIFSGKTRTVWESKLDTTIDFKPVFVVNHQTGQNEVFVQDLNNTVYLINQVGRILWKVRLPEKINSEVYQIDYYKNGKLQLLFSSRNQIYLMDRNGNDVEKYPVKLRAPATCGLSVFDYDNNRNYRLFIACEDKSVYAYNKEGNLVSGWRFDKSESTVSQPVSHFRIGNKDFIVFGDQYKTYILDRKGDTRVSADTYFPRSANNNYILDLPRNGNAPSIVSTDTSGRAYMISFTGKVSILEPPRRFSNQHYFDCKDMDGDGQSEFIYLDENRLFVYDRNMEEVFERDFKSEISERPVYFQFSGTDRKLGVVNKKENKVYLVNNNGTLYSGFPLQGSTLFSIGHFGDSLAKFSLVVGNNNQFLYNYRVQ